MAEEREKDIPGLQKSTGNITQAWKWTPNKPPIVTGRLKPIVKVTACLNFIFGEMGNH